MPKTTPKASARPKRGETETLSNHHAVSENELSLNPDDIESASDPIVAEAGLYRLEIGRARPGYPKEEAKFPDAKRFALTWKITGGEKFDPDVSYRRITSYLTLPIRGSIPDVEAFIAISNASRHFLEAISMSPAEFAHHTNALHFPTDRTVEATAAFLIGKTATAYLKVKDSGEYGMQNEISKFASPE